MLGKYWEHYPHDADIGIRGIGATKEEAFEQAAVALTAVVTDPHNVAPLEEVEIECDAPDDELLFAEWLNALIYQMAVSRMLFSRFEVRIDGARLSGKARGEAVDIDRHKPAVEVKGATYTQLKVARDETGTWLAQCVVDV
jgi:SHS2 domain-containing protein